MVATGPSAVIASRCNTKNSCGGACSWIFFSAAASRRMPGTVRSSCGGAGIGSVQARAGEHNRAMNRVGTWGMRAAIGLATDAPMRDTASGPKDRATASLARWPRRCSRRRTGPRRYGSRGRPPKARAVEWVIETAIRRLPHSCHLDRLYNCGAGSGSRRMRSIGGGDLRQRSVGRSVACDARVGQRFAVNWGARRPAGTIGSASESVIHHLRKSSHDEYCALRLLVTFVRPRDQDS